MHFSFDELMPLSITAAVGPLKAILYGIGEAYSISYRRN